MPNQQHRSPAANDGETSAAGVSTPGTRRYRRVIDAHVHWYPREFVELMIKRGPANGAVMGEDANGNPVVVSVPCCTQKSVMRKTMTNLDDIIAALSEQPEPGRPGAGNLISKPWRPKRRMRRQPLRSWPVMTSNVSFSPCQRPHLAGRDGRSPLRR